MQWERKGNVASEEQYGENPWVITVSTLHSADPFEEQAPLTALVIYDDSILNKRVLSHRITAVAEPYIRPRSLSGHFSRTVVGSEGYPGAEVDDRIVDEYEGNERPRNSIIDFRFTTFLFVIVTKHSTPRQTILRIHTQFRVDKIRLIMYGIVPVKCT